MYADDDDYNDEVGDVLADRDGYPFEYDGDRYEPAEEGDECPAGGDEDGDDHYREESE